MSSSLLDSTPVFLARLKVVGVPDVQATRMCASTVNTMAKLAWASSSQPGMGDDSGFIAMLVQNLGLQSISDIPSGELSAWRRIWFEAHTIGVSDLRQKVERTEDSAPRRLPVPERAAKLAAQRQRLSGVPISGPLLPSHSLVDFVFTMREDEVLKYVEPSKCTCRDSELRGVKREQFVKPNASGVLMIKESDSHDEADLTSEHKVKQALMRRSLALDQADLLPFSVSEDYHNFLFSLVAMEPPPRFCPIDVIQILNADRAIWSRMTEHTESGISIRPDGSYPMQEALALARSHPMVSCLLQPLPKPSGGGGKGGKDKVGRDAPYAAKGANGGKAKAGKGSKGKKGKGKGKTQSKDRLPYALIGCKARTADGQKLCFDFNLPCGCSREAPSGKCNFGVHACAGCLSAAHGYQQCTAASV